MSADTYRKFRIISVLANGNPSLAQIHSETGIPLSTVKRLIPQIRADYDMDIRFVENDKGRGGRYHIVSWGVLDRVEFQLRFARSA
jgi:hypothetical protein